MTAENNTQQQIVSKHLPMLPWHRPSEDNDHSKIHVKNACSLRLYYTAVCCSHIGFLQSYHCRAIWPAAGALVLVDPGYSERHPFNALFRAGIAWHGPTNTPKRHEQQVAHMVHVLWHGLHTNYSIGYQSYANQLNLGPMSRHHMTCAEIIYRRLILAVAPATH